MAYEVTVDDGFVQEPDAKDDEPGFIQVVDHLRKAVESEELLHVIVVAETVENDIVGWTSNTMYISDVVGLLEMFKHGVIHNGPSDVDPK